MQRDRCATAEFPAVASPDKTRDFKNNPPTPRSLYDGLLCLRLCVASLLAFAILLACASPALAAAGLQGAYYGNSTLSGTPAVTRTDATVNFNWGSGSPATGIAADQFSVRWTGSVEPLYSEQYTFYTVSDDGVRLWVDGQLIINNWTLHSPTENSGTITLQAGRSYNIQMEYYENAGGAVAQLLWSSASQAKVAIPTTQLSTIPEWTPNDIGTVGVAGETTLNESTGTFTILGSGTDIWNTADSFHYVHQPFLGDGEITARVASVQETHEWARVGLMIRESLAANARHASVLVTPQHGVITQARLTVGGSSSYQDTGAYKAPVWVRLARKGSVFTSYTSPDGVNWAAAGTQVIPNLPARLFVGMAVCSHNNSVRSTATFNNVSVRQGLTPAVDTDGDGIPDSWETANTFDPNSASDATGDADADGFNNLTEFVYGTNPLAVDKAGTISVEVLAASGYEKEQQHARFRINRTGSILPVTVNFTLTGRAIPASTGGDYRPESSARTVRTTSIPLPGGASSAELILRTVTDTLNEYPEDITLTLSANSRYTLGTTTTAAATLYDATDIPANEELFVAFLGPQGTARTYASGIGTIFLNGPRTAARVSLNFSGLTSNQTNAYIRYGVASGVGPELRPTLPIGQVSNQTWTIVPAGTVTGQDQIDGLFQKDGKWVYINIGTGNYPAGEIAGTWTKQSGSTTFTPPAAPPAIETLSGDALTRDVARFLTQATYGPTQAEIQALANQITTQHGGSRIAGYNAWIDEQFALDQTNLYDYTYYADQEEWAKRATDPINYTSTTGEPNYHNRRRGWWLIAAKAHDQLRQRVAFALSQILVISEREGEIQTRHYGAATYYDMLATAASGNFRDLLESVTKSPMMGKYLSHLKNQKAVINSTTGQVIISPDENYAREIMQLFSIGLVHRHPDGSLKLGADGLPIPTYGQTDITELARVFTGWSFSKGTGAKASGYPTIDNTNFNLGSGPKYFQISWIAPMKNFATYHDTGAKTVLGTNIAAGLDGEADLDAALNIIFNHPNTGPFISRLLIQRLVTSNPSAGYIYRVAQKFANNGSGVRGDLKAVVKQILLDYEARSLTVTSNVGYGKQKEPILRYIQLVRAFDGKSIMPLSNLSTYSYPATQLDNFPAGTTRYRYPSTDTPLGQTPLRAPTVFNWFLPDFNPGAAIASAGLVAPEMQLTNETSVVAAINYEYTMAQGDLGQSVDGLIGSTDTNEDNVRLDRTPLVQMYDAEITAGKTAAQATTTVLNHLDVLLCAGNLRARYETLAAPNPRTMIIDNVSTMSTTTIQRIKELIYLLGTSPEYLHQK